MSEVKVDTISERTAAGGVTIDGVLIKDGVATFQTAAGSPLVFEGATADAYETTFAITDPTADRTITFPDADVTLGASGNNTPMFSAYLSSDQTLTDATYEKIQFDTITVTDGGTYDNITNFRWTPGTAGKYVIKTNIGYDYFGGNYTDLADANVRFYVNGSLSTGMSFDNHFSAVVQNVSPGHLHLQNDIVFSMSDTDYIEVYGYMHHVYTSYANIVVGNQATNFSAFKLIGS